MKIRFARFAAVVFGFALGILVLSSCVPVTPQAAPEFPIAEPDYNAKLARDFSPFADALYAFSAERTSELDRALAGATILEIQAMMDAGELTSVELITYYVSRIRKYDVDMLNSVMELNPDALDIAAQLDAERAAGDIRGPMHGIPVLLKANIATADRMKTTAGAVAMADWQPGRDAFLVQQLRDAGAVILGKTNLSEWANYMDPSLPNGFSALGGQTRAAYGAYDPLGSSTGSAVAAAANLATVTVGTETQGSIVLPSKVNGVVGLKTSRNLVSGDYVIPLVNWMDTPGPIGRNVTDVAILLTAMTASGEANPEIHDVSELADTDFTRYLSPELAQSLRVGLIVPPKEVFDQVISGATGDTGRALTADEIAATRRVLGDLAGDPQVIAPILNAQGIETEEIDLLGEQERLVNPDPLPALEYGFRDSFDAFMAALGDNAPYASLGDVVAFNSEDLSNRAPYGQHYLEGSVNTEITAEEYAVLQEENMRLGAEVLRSLFEAYDVDLIMCRNCTQAYAPAGFPALSVPDGYDLAGKPLSLILIGDYLSEPELISVGHAYEKGAPPSVGPDLDLRMQQIAPVVP